MAVAALLEQADRGKLSQRLAPPNYRTSHSAHLRVTETHESLSGVHDKNMASYLSCSN